MSKFHVRCGSGAIFAGTFKKNAAEWRDSTEVTEETLAAVRDWLLQMRPDDAEQVGFRWEKKAGGTISLVLAETFEDEERQGTEDV